MKIAFLLSCEYYRIPFLFLRSSEDIPTGKAGERSYAQDVGSRKLENEWQSGRVSRFA